MIDHLFGNFLDDARQYRASEAFWEDRWLGLGKVLEEQGWSYPWISTGSPDCRDGNPIFSAWSPTLRRGVRIIQHEPTRQRVEIQAWPDFVGGNYYDRDAVQELVISCALSEAAADWAMSLLRLWVKGKSIDFSKNASGNVSADPWASDWALDGALLPFAA